MSWPLVSIKDVAKVITGKTPSTKEIDNFDGDIPFVTPAELGNDIYVISSPRSLSEKGASGVKTVPKNAVMVCCIGSLGKLAIAGRDVATNQQINSVVFDEEKVNYKYGFYALTRLKPEMEPFTASTTVPIINKSNFESLRIPVPPIAEQKRIASILDKADSIRRKRQQAIAMADEFLRSVFLDMFGDPVTNPKGWSVKRLDDIAISFQNGIGKGKDFYGRGAKVANIGDLYEKPYFKPDKYSLLEVSDDEIERYKLVTGDLLFVRSSVKREGVAYCSSYDSEEICLFSSFMIRVKLISSEVNSKFISVQMRTKGIHDALVKASNTSTHTNINQAGLSGVNVIVPPIKLQEKFVSIADKVVEFLNVIYSSENNMVDCFESLSQKAFAGEL